MGRTEASFSQEKGQKTDLIDLLSKNDIKITLDNIPRRQLIAKENTMQGIENIEEIKQELSWGRSLQPLTVTGMECGKYLLVDGRRRLAAVDSLIADPQYWKWTKESMIPVFIVWQPVTRRFRVYGLDGHRQRASFGKSERLYPWDHLSEITCLCSDRTGTTEYVELIITGPEWYISRELLGQISDGIFENCRVGKVTEIVNGREISACF